MRREEKRRKFHEALLNTLYPQQPLQEENQQPDSIAPSSENEFDVNLIPDDYGVQQESSSSTSNDNGDGECEQQKLTRAQRKKFRKKKLKEEIYRRGNMIGPLLPSSSSDLGGGSSAVGQYNQSVRHNAEESVGDGIANSESNKKLKQRRMAKRLAREKLKTQDVENQDQSFEAGHVENCDKNRNVKNMIV